jgi:hypothetical protein
MEPINLLRYLMTRCKTRKVLSPYLEKDIHRLHDKPKFLLPVGGKVFDISSDLKDAPDVIRLPFNEFFMEYPSFIHKDDLEYITGSAATIPLKYKDVEQIPYTSLVLVKQLEGVFELRLVTLFQGDGNGDNEIWQIPSFSATVNNAVDRNPKESEVGLLIDYDATSPEFLASDAYVTYVKFPDTFEKLFKFIYIEPIFAVLELVVALGCKNVTHQELTPRRLNKSAKKRGALPFDSYRVLSVVTNGKAEKIVATNGAGGDRHSPREHMRRGHIRTCASGVKTWVQPTVVNAGIGSVLNKDYKIK